MVWTLIIAAVVVFIVMAFMMDAKAKRDREEMEYWEEREKENQRIKLETVTIPAYNKARSELTNKYGEPIKSIVLEQYNLDKEIDVFEKDKRVWICGKDYPMKTILSCTFNDNPTVSKGSSVSTTATNNGNMVKRAVVGQVIAGGAGAVIGGATASKTTVTTQSSDKITHNYTVLITVNSLADPIIRIPLGQDGKTVNEIVALMNVVINMK